MRSTRSTPASASSKVSGAGPAKGRVWRRASTISPEGTDSISIICPLSLIACLLASTLESRQILVNKLHGDRSLAHRRSHALYRPVPHIAGHKHARHAGLEQKRLPGSSANPPAVCHRSAGPARPARIPSRPAKSRAAAIRARRRADKHKQRRRRNPVFSLRPAQLQRLQPL